MYGVPHGCEISDICSLSEMSSVDCPNPRPVDTREMPAGALIEGKAKRYKAEDGPEAAQQYSAMTVISNSL